MFGGALSFNGIDGTIAAGIPTGLPPTPPTISIPISAGELCDSGIEVPDISIGFDLPPVKVDSNVLVNGCNMTVKADGFGELLIDPIDADLDTLTNVLCNPPDIGFEVPDIASIGNVRVNGIKSAIPDVPYNIASIIDESKMAMQTAQTNVKLYW